MRRKIRQKGAELLRNLHDPKYGYDRFGNKGRQALFWIFPRSQPEHHERPFRAQLSPGPVEAPSYVTGGGPLVQR